MDDLFHENKIDRRKHWRTDNKDFNACASGLGIYVHGFDKSLIRVLVIVSGVMVIFITLATKLQLFAGEINLGYLGIAKTKDLCWWLLFCILSICNLIPVALIAFGWKIEQALDCIINHAKTQAEKSGTVQILAGSQSLRTKIDEQAVSTH